jgi:hypothetical protein
VPLIGVGVAIERRWVRVPNPGDSGGVMWCGGQLHKNTILAEQAWRRFIDMIAPATRES